MRILAGLLALAVSTAQAQSFPTKPVRIIVPFAPGGANDLMARYLCERFPQSLGQPCLVENRTGAGGMIGIDAAAKAEPDGHTLLMVPNNIVTIPMVYAKVPYEPQDLAPIALVSSTPIMIGAHPSFPVKTFTELLAYAKENNGKVQFTACGPASAQHLAGELLAAEAGFKWTHIPYKGCGDALTAVLGEQVPVFISTVAHFNPQIKSGKLRGYAVMGSTRSAFAPDYPTAIEAGYPDLVFDLWFGLMTGSRVPVPIQARLNAELNKALQSPDLREKLAQQFYEPIGGTPERFVQAMRADTQRYGRAIKEAGIKPE
ncbi:MAG: tripartite tricarboxylate transporter substrate binding protein [Betaproteobacteria bacterium]|nr:tripartite tricarboxylate transporter substrate binding protein [Betaproteobacteria bacterium]MBV9360411.1 tripartite tricarboxylate transporter substrate binding protein [Betaproteobacteria bacterium]